MHALIDRILENEIPLHFYPFVQTKFPVKRGRELMEFGSHKLLGGKFKLYISRIKV
jgi:hypothetical protein